MGRPCSSAWAHQNGDEPVQPYTEPISRGGRSGGGVLQVQRGARPTVQRIEQSRYRVGRPVRVDVAGQPGAEVEGELGRDLTGAVVLAHGPGEAAALEKALPCKVEVVDERRHLRDGLFGLVGRIELPPLRFQPSPARFSSAAGGSGGPRIRKSRDCWSAHRANAPRSTLRVTWPSGLTRLRPRGWTTAVRREPESRNSRSGRSLSRELRRCARGGS
jgi:hypothetical protein